MLLNLIESLNPQKLASILLKEIIADLDEKFGSGDISAATYDTAWVAMVRNPNKPKKLAFPDSFNCILKSQAEDGSWGGLFPYTLLPTLAALLALLKAPEPTTQVHYAVKRAKHYLENALLQWSVKKHESIGFELLAPMLLEELEKLDLIFEFPDKNELLKIRSQKLLITSPKLIYSGQSTLIHSLEAFGAALDFKRLKQQQAINGSYGGSPSATAAVLIYGSEWDNAAAEWLTHLSNRAFDGVVGNMPTAYPIDVFEIAWVLNNLASGGFNLQHNFSQPLVQKLCTWLQQSLTPQGVTPTRFVGIPTDSDDTGMALAALNKAQIKVPIDSLVNFERSDYFSCFKQERGSSITANAHVLTALLSLSKSEQISHQTRIAKVVDFLYSMRNEDGFWQDKWHKSSFYATACSVMSLTECKSLELKIELQPTLQWVLQTQSIEDGGWGYNGYSTLEETAYALQILQSLHLSVNSSYYIAYKRATYQGIKYILKHFNGSYFKKNIQLSNLWRGKELYTPKRVVFSAAIAVLNQYGAK
jgi:halimadienyl-diphosphate synthase